MKHLLPIFFALILIVTIQSCKVCGCVAPPLNAELMGRWQWVKTETPSKTLTPQTTGVTQILEYGNDNTTNYIQFYKNDSLSTRYSLTQGTTQQNTKELSVLEKFGSQYLKFYIIRNSSYSNRDMYTSELMPNYTEKADTIRHYYRYMPQ